MTNTELIPFKVETQRVLELFATQIYHSPLALLRENTQNAFDAIRLRLHDGQDFKPKIDITISPTEIVVEDNGLGMTEEDLKQHFWQAGSSSKNTAEARAAGVVGTFGIGAMASFGIADAVTVETESALNGERRRSHAEKAKLSLTENCVELADELPTGFPGTRVVAHVRAGETVNVQQARDYISDFVALVDLPVLINGELVSQKPIESAVPVVPETWRLAEDGRAIGQHLVANVLFVLSNNAEIWLKLTEMTWQGAPLTGQIVLRSGTNALRTFRSGFGLATVSVNSAYQFGGVVDLLNLQPTAGREAITVDGVQMLQSIMVDIDRFTSEVLSNREECDSSTPFMSWVSRHGRVDLMGRLKATITPGDRISLAELQIRTAQTPILYYQGTDQGIVKQHATDERPVLVLARGNPRRQCEQLYIQSFVKTASISDKPIANKKKPFKDLSTAESALAWRLETILDADYFVKAKVAFASITHNLPILAEKNGNQIQVILDPESQSVRMLLEVYDRDFAVFGGLAKDFVRNIVFQRIADYVPSSTRQGAEAFLSAIRKTRELFEYGDLDLGSLPQIWEDQEQGRITLDEAVQRSRIAARTNVQFIDAGTAVRASQVVGDVIENEHALQIAEGGSTVESSHSVDFESAPAITRVEKETSAKLLIIDDSEPALRGYRCFLALSDRAREEMGEFFLQPHKTSIVWGGQKTLFIFLHHSGEFGLYYDLQTREAIDANAGGGPFPTATIVLKNAIYIPIPDAIRDSFVPIQGERKRFEVRADIIRTESSETRGRLSGPAA
ncbi:ATP-binding protein [Brevundimonas sp.]|uniref:ATP-binding protein n=1 Tax=Brevundimonas sp. TaxID=1871086 RepID=UPI00262B64D5|nr:ATP-binding protein [Brevundimonas sp.]